MHNRSAAAVIFQNWYNTKVKNVLSPKQLSKWQLLY